uniref:Uncharacterized protein n=1 Tax=Plectus sambesii TaxID=2011161 RepID=A0A914XCB7_9BILA
MGCFNRSRLPSVHHRRRRSAVGRRSTGDQHNTDVRLIGGCVDETRLKVATVRALCGLDCAGSTLCGFDSTRSTDCHPPDDDDDDQRRSLSVGLIRPSPPFIRARRPPFVAQANKSGQACRRSALTNASISRLMPHPSFFWNGWSQMAIGHFESTRARL